MKYLYRMGFCMAAIAVGTSSCVDHGVESIQVDKPESIVLQEDIDSYEALKTYVNREGNPNFKLGAGVSLSEYMSRGVMQRLINRNFDEMTLGYAMKHGAVVQEDGSLNLGSVSGFLEEAAEAGVSVYGHTLVWHANQNAEYLNKSIAPEVSSGAPTWEPVMEIDFETDDATSYEANAGAILSFTAEGEGANGEGRALVVTNEEVRAAEWDSQIYLSFPEAMVEGEKYELTMDVRSDAPASSATQAQSAPGAYIHWDFFGAIATSAEWSAFSKQITISAENAGAKTIAINLGLTATNYYFDNIKLTKLNENGGGASWVPISVADFEGEDASNYQGNTNAVMTFTADGDGANGEGRALKITNDVVRANDYDVQLFITFDPATAVGDKYMLTMDVRADDPASFPTQAHTVPYAYKHYDFFGTVNATTEWASFSREIIIADNTSEVTTIAFNLGATATSYYFDNIRVSKYSEDGAGIEKTPEEKKEIITNEMERWVAGMLEISKGYVKAWDVLNEPMDDGNPYELKTGVGKTLAADEFYWQDYLGKDYAVEAFRLAREYGNPDDIHFINDYNLEYNLDKCKGIIQLVEYIESKGETVDGIGTQMHINTDSDKGKIAEMFKLLAATGKLIKVSELDIGLAGGTKTNAATAEEYQAQSEMYRYVVEKYLELIPSSQQYGITVWSPRDSPESSSWRAGEPIGLWTEGFVRKPAYTGFANGLGKPE